MYKVLSILFLLSSYVYAASISGLGLDKVVGWIAGPLIGGLVVYFFSTRNLEAAVKRITQEAAKEQVDIHNKISHQENHWAAIEKHKDDCGDKLEEKLQQVQKSVHNIDMKHATTNTALMSISATVHAIAKKMNILPFSRLPSDSDTNGG